MEHSLLITLLILSMAIVSFGLKAINKWKYCEYEWESQQQKEDAINRGFYDLYECYLNDINKADDGRIFVTAPREFGPGSPATLATITNETGPGGPLLRPYPNWSWHKSSWHNSCMCEDIVNIYYMYIKCNHIFVLDNGQIGPDQVCNPKLLIFDLKNDTLVKTIYIPLDIATNKTSSGLLVMPFVYLPGKCERLLEEMIVFMTDTGGSGLIIYESSKKRMCRVESDYMKPTDSSFSIAGQNFTYVGGIMSITIVDDDLYYALASGKELYKIKIKTLLECPNKEKTNKQTKLVKKFNSQIIPLTTVGKTIFYSNIREMSILGTNVCKQSSNNTVVLLQDSKKLQAVFALQYLVHWDQLIFLSSRYQRFALKTVNLDEIHFRHFEMNLADIRKNTRLFSQDQ